jgi:aspartyl-tRNA synthetase
VDFKDGARLVNERRQGIVKALETKHAAEVAKLKQLEEDVKAMEGKPPDAATLAQMEKVRKLEEELKVQTAKAANPAELVQAQAEKLKKAEADLAAETAKPVPADEDAKAKTDRTKKVEKLEKVVKSLADKLQKPEDIVKVETDKVQRLERQLKSESDKIRTPENILKGQNAVIQRLEAQIRTETEKFQNPAEDITTENEKMLGEIVKELHHTDLYVLMRFPLATRAFYTHPDPEDPVASLSFDVEMRGQEIVSGARRIDSRELLVERGKALGIDIPSEYLDAFKFGAPPHGGIGIGLERVTAFLLNLDSVKQACLFPRFYGMQF